MPMAEYLQLFLPQLLLAATAVLALLAEMLHRAKLAFGVTLAGYAVVTASAITLLGTDTAIFMDTYRINDVSIWASIILSLTTAACVLLWRERWRGDSREATGYALFSLATLGAIVLAGAADLMFLVIGVLLTGIASFALVAFSQTPRSTEAAMKYFVYAAASGAIMIFGLTYWFGAVGSTLFIDMMALADQPMFAVVGFIGVVAGLGYIMSAVPLHQWTPDTYQGTSIPVAAYVSVVPKLGAVFGLLQLVIYLPDTMQWQMVVAIVAAGSIMLGTLAALAQQNVVRLLAYSSIAQTGYLLLAVIGAGGSLLSSSAAVVFGAAYAAMNIAIFAIVQLQGREIDDYRGGFKNHPLRSFALIVALLSLVGIPPLAGFVGKLLLFGVAIDADYTWLAVIGIIGSILSLGAYLRIIIPLFQAAQDTGTRRSRDVSILSTSVWLAGLVLTVGLGVGGQLFF